MFDGVELGTLHHFIERPFLLDVGDDGEGEFAFRFFEEVLEVLALRCRERLGTTAINARRSYI